MEASGLGWLPMYIGQFREYAAMPGDTRRDVWCKIPMSEGYTAIAVGMSLNGWLQFSGVTLADGGYIRAEVDKLMKLKPQ
jgi:hypothetical protein